MLQVRKSMVCPPVRSMTHSLKLLGYFSIQADNYALSSTLQQFTGCSYSCQPHDCQEIKDLGHKDSGVYHITPLGTYSGFDVYCDMSTEDGGWLVSVENIQIFPQLEMVFCEEV